MAANINYHCLACAWQLSARARASQLSSSQFNWPIISSQTLSSALSCRRIVNKSVHLSRDSSTRRRRSQRSSLCKLRLACASARTGSTIAAFIAARQAKNPDWRRRLCAPQVGLAASRSPRGGAQPPGGRLIYVAPQVARIVVPAILSAGQAIENCCSAAELCSRPPAKRRRHKAQPIKPDKLLARKLRARADARPLSFAASLWPTRTARSGQVAVWRRLDAD